MLREPATIGRAMLTGPTGNRAVADRKITRAARGAVAAGLTAFILFKSHPRSVLANAAGADWRPIVAAGLIVLVDRVLMAYRWVALLCTVDPRERPAIPSLLHIFFVSTFV